MTFEEEQKEKALVALSAEGVLATDLAGVVYDRSRGRTGHLETGPDIAGPQRAAEQFDIVRRVFQANFAGAEDLTPILVAADGDAALLDFRIAVGTTD